MKGIQRFLDRYYRFAKESLGKKEPLNNSLETLVHQTIKKVEEDIESMNFNTAISSLMILLNEIYKQNIRDESLAKLFTKLLQVFAPHLAEEVWEDLGEKDFVCKSEWPKYSPKKITTEEICIGVQVNGKTRGSLQVSKNTSEKEALEKALNNSSCEKRSK